MGITDERQSSNSQLAMHHMTGGKQSLFRMTMKPGSKIGLEEWIRSDRGGEIRSMCLHPADFTPYNKEPSGPSWTNAATLP